MPIENISDLTALTTPATGDQLIIKDVSAGPSAYEVKSITLGELLQFIQGGGGVVAVTAATLAVDRDTHAGKVVTLSRAGGIDITMPAATGSGDKYTFVVLTATADAYAIAGTGDDDFAGTVFGFDGDGEPANGWTDADATSLAFGGTSQATGGSIGDRIELIDAKADLWVVTGWITQGGTEATPFVA